MCNKILFSIIFLAQLYFGVASAADLTIPDAIKVPEGNSAYLTVHAKGDQIYLCGFDAGVYTWKWQAPDAKLYDIQAQALVGSHGAGPSWVYKDGSSVKAKVIQKSSTTDKSSVPLLLLEVTGHKGDGLMAKATYIQRINTLGGVAPLSGCDANHLGSEKRVVYSADYNFYSK
jgi:Protein of unknown function (DUF3455)